MQRFTISLDDELARQFDAFIAEKGYVNRSEAVRDLIRTRLGNDRLGGPSRRAASGWCVANVSYVYDHHEQMVFRATSAGRERQRALVEHGDSKRPHRLSHRQVYPH